MDITDNKFIQCFYDLINFFKFRKMIKNEMKRADSKMTQLNIKRNWLGNILYVQLNCTDTDFMNAEYVYDRMLMIKLKPYIEYLSKELGWTDYLVPQISNFVDDEGNMSLSFGILFIFTGYSLTLTRFLMGMLTFFGLLSAGLWYIFNFLI